MSNTVSTFLSGHLFFCRKEARTETIFTFSWNSPLSRKTGLRGSGVHKDNYNTHSHTHTHTHTHTHKHTHTLMCARTHTHTRACTYTHTGMHIPTHVHVHAHTHTHTQTKDNFYSLGFPYEYTDSDNTLHFVQSELILYQVSLHLLHFKCILFMLS